MRPSYAVFTNDAKLDAVWGVNHGFQLKGGKYKEDV
jgi:hypothetical protein